jgi:hypothetical protein
MITVKEYINILKSRINKSVEKCLYINPDDYKCSANYLKKIARQQGLHAKGNATIILSVNKF